MKKVFPAVLITAFLLLNQAQLISAHSEIHSFQTIEAEKILIVYYNLEQFQQNIAQNFFLKFYQLADGRPIEFDLASIQFSKDGKVLKKTIVKKEIDQPPVFSYNFPQSGKYEMQAELFKDSKLLIKGVFPILVSGTDIEQPELLEEKIYWLILLTIIPVAYFLGTKQLHLKIKKVWSRQ